MGKLFYGTQSGMTEDVAAAIHAALPELISEVKCVDRATADDLASEDFLVLGGSNWGDGELTDDWTMFWPNMDKIDFTGKKVALFSLGDQRAYGDHFCSAMRELYDKVIERGGTIAGEGGSVTDYDFDHSDSVKDGKFIGLAVDDMNECDLTDERIAAWAETVRASVGTVAAA